MIPSPAQQVAVARGFSNPNSCGQGDHPDVAKVPVLQVVVDAGWRYSHTTGITIGPGDGYELHLTFKRGEHRVTFWIDATDLTWRWSGSWGGSGIHTTSRVPDDVRRYLLGVARRAKKARRDGFA